MSETNLVSDVSTDAAYHSIFVGYFPETIPLENIANFLRSDCRDFKRIRIARRHKNALRSISFCRIDFEQSASALASSNILNGMKAVGITLTTRPWITRTAANERRAVSWRKESWDHAERRDSDRRDYFLKFDFDLHPALTAMESEGGLATEQLCVTFDQHALSAWVFWVEAIDRPDADKWVTNIDDARIELQRVQEHDFLREEMKQWLQERPTKFGMERFRRLAGY